MTASTAPTTSRETRSANSPRSASTTTTWCRSSKTKAWAPLRPAGTSSANGSRPRCTLGRPQARDDIAAREARQLSGRRPGAMDGSSVIFIVMPIVIPLVLFAGIAGLNVARALRHADADVTIVDGHDYHTFQPLLYQVSTGYLAPEEVGTALRAVFRRQANVRVRLGKA